MSKQEQYKVPELFEELIRLMMMDCAYEYYESDLSKYNIGDVVARIYHRHSPELLKQFKEVQEERNEFLSAIHLALKVKELWCPEWTENSSEEHNNEAVSLNNMKEIFESAINKTIEK